MFRKWSMIIVGGLLVITGAITFWLPLPIGLPLILLGGPLLIRHSPGSRRWWLRNRRRLPFLNREKAG